MLARCGAAAGTAAAGMLSLLEKVLAGTTAKPRSSLPESAENVDQANIPSVGARPDASLRHRVYLGDGHAASFSDEPQKLIVGPVHGASQVGPFGRRHAAKSAHHVCRWSGLNAVDCHA